MFYYLLMKELWASPRKLPACVGRCGSLFFFSSSSLWFYSWASKMEALTSKSAADPEGYLAHPVNAYKLVKRLNTEWPALGDLVLQDSAAGEGQ